MSRIYKICVVGNVNENAGEVFAIKPYLESFDSFKDEIFIRMPELKNHPLKIYYQDADGDRITIFNALDFGIFQEQKINKVFVVKSAPPKTVQFQENPVNAPVFTSAASTSAPNRAHHANVVCDGCDKEIYGYRYKCLECHDFDLCMECEPKSHNHHLMIRIADPNDAEICYKSKLGKRFLRHRRSESLCSKPEEKIGKHHHGHHGYKRHASSTSARPPHPFGDIVYGVLQSLAGTNNNANQNTNAATNTEVPCQGTNEEKQPKIDKGAQASAPPSAPAYGFTAGNPSPKSPCVPLKQSIDMLSHMAHNFATMMDPFSTYMEQINSSSSASASSAAASATLAAGVAAAGAGAAAAAAATQAKAADSTPTTKESTPDNTSADAENESMVTDQEASTGDKEPTKVSDVMIIDCSDDEEEDLRNLVTSLHVDSNKTNNNAPEANKNVESTTSIEYDKSSPSREWTFIERNEITDSVGTSVSNSGAIPKKSTPPQVESSGIFNKVDYAELSRLLNTHIHAQKDAEVEPPQTEEKAKTDVTDNGVKSTKTPPPTPLHPDARVNEALTAMMAMGFSNEGGWLSQLLETVDGSISNALDLLQPQK